MVSEKDRKDYEAGQKYREKSTVERVATDLGGNHPGTEAYYKGCRGEQLDADKKKEK